MDKLSASLGLIIIMVAIARALVSKPKFLMLDEPYLGLSPNVLADVFQKIIEVNRTQGVTILIVVQKVRKVFAIADHAYSLNLAKSHSPAQPLHWPMIRPS